MAASEMDDVFKVFHAWHLDFAVKEYWEEYKNECTVDAKTDRELYAGIIQAILPTDKTVNDNFQKVKFLHLLSRLVDGRDPDIKYIGKNEGTPLETAISVLDELLSCFPNLEYEGEGFKTLIKKQAVLVCCEKTDLDNAEDVYHRVFDQAGALQSVQHKQMKEEVLKILKYKSNRDRRKYVRDNSYEKFHQQSVKFLDKIHITFKKPHLLQIIEDNIKKGTEGTSHYNHLEPVRTETVVTDDDDETDMEIDIGQEDHDTVDDIAVISADELKKTLMMFTDDVTEWRKIRNHELSTMTEIKEAILRRERKSRKKSEKMYSPAKKVIEIVNGNEVIDDIIDDITETAKSPSKISDNEGGDDGAGSSSSPRPSSPQSLIRKHRYASARNRVLYTQPDGEPVTWSDSDSDVSTPPRRIPNINDIIPAPRIRQDLLHFMDDVRIPKKKILWTNTEVTNLKKGVKLYGAGNWSTILNGFEFNQHRTGVSLKDKWRNLVKIGDMDE